MDQTFEENNMERQKIVIVGGGHGAIPSAAHNALLGHEVTVVNRTYENVAELAQAGEVTLIYSDSSLDSIFRTEALHLDRNQFMGEPIDGALSRDLGIDDLVAIQVPLNGVYGFDEQGHREDTASAVLDADLIRVIIPAVGHRWAAEQLAPYLTKDKGVEKTRRILLEPERTCGVIEFFHALKKYEQETGNELDWDRLILGGANTFVFASRRRGMSPQAYILGSKDRLRVSTLPADRDDELVEYLQTNLFPQAKGVPNVLHTSLGNLGTIFHSVLTLLWTSLIGVSQRLEDQGSPLRLRVQHYADVTSDMGRLLEGADQERLAVAKAFGVNVKSARKWLQEVYGATGPDLATALNNCKAYWGLPVPRSVNHRYIWEDARMSALPIAELGRLAGIETPRLYGIVYFCNDLFPDVDFFKDGRTLKNLGLEGMSVDDVIKLARFGNGYQKK